MKHRSIIQHVHEHLEKEYYSKSQYERKGSIYCNIQGDFEKMCYDYEYSWQKPIGAEHITHEEFVEHFYCVILPLADTFPDYDPDTMLRDFGMVNERYEIDGINRYFFAGYTPHGIQRIDSYFGYRIQKMNSHEEAHWIESQLIYCPHLHPRIKENLALNLNNYMLRLKYETDQEYCEANSIRVIRKEKEKVLSASEHSFTEDTVAY